MKPLKSKSSWAEAKDAVKRASFDLDSRRGVLPPELERAKHATEDVDTPVVSPRASPRASYAHFRDQRNFDDEAL